jgi:hypothetical protein
MRIVPILLSAFAALGLAACNTSTRGPAAPPVSGPDGFLHYSGGGDVQCDVRPVAFDASHTRVQAIGGCRAIRVTGDHNDVIVQMAPGGLIEVTGAHNDVWWRPAGPGPAPVFRNLGASNTLHRDED